MTQTNNYDSYAANKAEYKRLLASGNCLDALRSLDLAIAASPDDDMIPILAAWRSELVKQVTPRVWWRVWEWAN